MDKLAAIRERLAKCAARELHAAHVAICKAAVLAEERDNGKFTWSDAAAMVFDRAAELEGA